MSILAVEIVSSAARVRLPSRFSGCALARAAAFASFARTAITCRLVDSKLRESRVLGASWSGVEWVEGSRGTAKELVLGRIGVA